MVSVYYTIFSIDQRIYTHGNADFNSLHFFIIKRTISDEFITHTHNDHRTTTYIFHRLLLRYTCTFLQC